MSAAQPASIPSEMPDDDCHRGHGRVHEPSADASDSLPADVADSLPAGASDDVTVEALGDVPAAAEPAPAPDEPALLASLPQRLRRVRSTGARTRDALPARGGCADDPQLSAATQRVWDAERAVAQSLAAQYRALAALHEHEGEYEEVCETDEVDTLRAGLGLRVTRSAAGWQLRDAYQAVHMLPHALARMESGALPSAWFQRMLRSARPLEDDSRRDLDLVISTWSTDISPERFFTLLRALVEHLRERESGAEQVEELERNVELLPASVPGMGIMQITGPIPEVLSRWKSLDESARAVQAAQRAALRDGTPIPHDPDGVVLETGRALPLSQLRFLLIAGAELDVDGVAVPVERFRLNVTVPVLTLLGASDEPGMLDGAIPLPPSMARSLAGGCAVWHRVLTGAASGAFLPLPADRVTPTPAMLEHLRLRSGRCAVPGCTRPVSWASECDHIEECLRGTPDAGGATSIENLHLLCWQHHLDKTNGLLDPVRLATAPTEPGRTRWAVGRDGDAVTVIDDVDTASLHMVEVLTSAWTGFLRGQRAGVAPPPPPPTAPAGAHAPPPTAPPAPRPITRSRNVPDTRTAPVSRPAPPSESSAPTAPRRVDPLPGSPPSGDPKSPPTASRHDDPMRGSTPPDGPLPRPDAPEPPPGGWGDWGPPPF